MLAAKYSVFRQAVLNHCLGVSILTAPANVKVRIFTVAPTSSGGGTAVTGGGYLDVTIAWNGSVTGSANGSGIATSGVRVDFGFASGANWGTIVAVDFRNAADNSPLYFATLDAPVTVLDSQGFAFNTGDIVWTET